MSISRLRPVRRRTRSAATPILEAKTYVLPPTVSREPLLAGDSDRSFRALVSNLFTISTRMELVREYLGRKLGITGPQYSLIVAIAHLQGTAGISVGSVAHALHVSSAFVASETGKLMRRNFLLKRINPLDRRGVLLSVAPAGRLKLDRVSEEIRNINDMFFGTLDAKAFAALSGAAAMLVESSGRAVQRLCDSKASSRPALRATG